jgi:hypothetical protein
MKIDLGLSDFERLVALDDEPTKIGLAIGFSPAQDHPDEPSTILVRRPDGSEEESESCLCHHVTLEEIENAGLISWALASEVDHSPPSFPE